MTDDDREDRALEAELRRLDDRPEPGPRLWQAMADGVRTQVQHALAEQARQRRRRRTGGLAAATSALALAAALLLWLRPGHRHPQPAPELSDDVTVLGDEVDPGDELDELDPALLERLDSAFKKGA